MRRQRDMQGIDRRKFLLGAGGAMLALPMLEAHSPRVAFGQSAAPPKRLLIVHNAQGRPAGYGYKEKNVVQDVWSPLNVTGAYPTTGTLSPMLAALGDIRNEIVTMDGIDNWVRHVCNDEDGHLSSGLSSLTCLPITGDQSPGGPSIDYVAGLRLRASSSQRSALIFPAGPMAEEYQYQGAVFYGAGGTPPTLINSNPAKAIKELFGAATTTTVPATKTLHDRLLARRPSILDSVAKSYEALRTKVSASDRDRLDQHATFIRSLETRLAGGGPVSVAKGCTRPLETAVPKYTQDDCFRGGVDGLITPYQIENIVMALACDVTRTAALHFHLDYDPTFESEFPAGQSPFAGSDNWHAMVHENQLLADPNTDALVQAFQYFGKSFARLITRLGEVTDTDGSRLLDNTLVLWTSDLGYGASHSNWNMPVVLAGMKSAFPKGQGRHVVAGRHSLGDLFSQMLRMLGGTDTTFGLTGTVGESLKSQGMKSPAGLPTAYDDAMITSALNFHAGPLDL